MYLNTCNVFSIICTSLMHCYFLFYHNMNMTLGWFSVVNIYSISHYRNYIKIDSKLRFFWPNSFWEIEDSRPTSVVCWEHFLRVVRSIGRDWWHFLQIIRFGRQATIRRHGNGRFHKSVQPNWKSLSCKTILSDQLQSLMHRQTSRSVLAATFVY